MTRRLIQDDLIVLDRPFAIFVEPGDVDEDGNIEWYAKIVGHELDNITSGPSPQRAIDDALDLLNGLTGKCTTVKPEHNWIIRRELDEGLGWECARCGEVAFDSQLEEVTGE